jgi:muconolactone delta-isomerase
MKFLVITTPRQVPMPPAMIADLLTAQREYLTQKVEDGTIDCIYGFVGGGGTGIANAESHEDMHRLLVESPAFPVVDYEVRALADFDATLEAGIGALRRAASMMAAASN